MSRREGAAPEPFGAANTHADFPYSFLELATWVKEGDTGSLPADTHLVPLEALAEVLPRQELNNVLSPHFPPRHGHDLEES
jgi:hypothetical protein